MILISADQITGATDISSNKHNNITDKKNITGTTSTTIQIKEYLSDTTTTASMNIDNNVNNKIKKSQISETTNTTYQKLNLSKDQFFDTTTTATKKIAYQLNNNNTTNNDQIVVDNKHNTQTTTTSSTTSTTINNIITTTTTTIHKLAFTTTTSSTTSTTINNMITTTTTTIYKLAFTTTTTIIKNNYFTVNPNINYDNKIEEITNDKTADYFYVDNTTKKSTMIIFPDKTENSPPSLNNNYEGNNEKSQISSTTPLDFIPKNENDFMNATFNYKYNENNIIITGENTIELKLAEILFSKAYKLYQESNITGSKSMFKKLVFYNYRIDESYYYLGWCYYIEKNYTLAIAYLKKTIFYIADKDSYKIAKRYYQIANIYFNIKEYYSAIKYYNKSLSFNDDFVKSFNGIGLSYYKMSEYKNALISWERGKNKGDLDCKNNYLWLNEQLNHQNISASN